MTAEIQQCREQIELILAELRAGHPDLNGLLLALADWRAELRLLEARANEGQ